MIKAPVGSNETERLQALLEYQILDTLPELAFDDITTLASSICDTPIAYVSLVDRDRQWFKSIVGFSATETPRDISFCGHTIQGNQILEIEDALHDVRFADNPFVLETPNIRFYAGAPLVNPQGFALGTLCVLDQKPRKLSAQQSRALEALARQVINTLELRKAMSELKSINSELKHYSSLVANQQSALIHAAKMTSLGEMAGGVAHEINNPLAIIVGRARRMLDLVQADQLSREDGALMLEKILATSFRISRIVQGLLAFSRNGEQDEMRDEKLDSIIRDALAISSEKLRCSGVQLTLVGDTAVSVHCQATQICQIINNLVSNSFDALKSLEQKWIELRVINRDHDVEIRFTDSGQGIPENVQKRMMEPFFTTKIVGQGTGLGLSISKGLAEASGGSLVYNAQSEHTQFILTLRKSRATDETLS